jgi:uncharacterized membrane protein YhhN
MIHFLLGLALVSALLDWYAVWKKNRRMEGVVKPLTMVFLIAWVFLFGQEEAILSTNLIYFLIGLGLCLVGDIFLFLPPERYFVFGLAAFLFGHIGYIVGFGRFETFSDYIIPFMIYLLVIGVSAYLIVGKLIEGLRRHKKERLILPLSFYAIVISVMLGSAGFRFFDTDWTIAGAYLAGGGALLFYISDVLNAWERFVNTFKHDRLIIMVTYHLGQFGLAIGAALHFAGKLPG